MLSFFSSFFCEKFVDTHLFLTISADQIFYDQIQHFIYELVKKGRVCNGSLKLCLFVIRFCVREIMCIIIGLISGCLDSIRRDNELFASTKRRA